MGTPEITEGATIPEPTPVRKARMFHQLPVLGMETQGSAGAKAAPS